MADLSTSTAVDDTTLIDSTELPAAVTVARRMLAAYGTVDYGQTDHVAQAHDALAESLRILVRALDRTAARQEYDAVRRSVDAQFPVIAAFLAAERVERGEGQ